MQFAVVIEKDAVSCGAHVPDLPGCVAAADTEAEVLQLIREAIVFHLQGMRQHGETIPEPTSSGAYVEVASAAGEYAVIIEKSATGYSAYVPDLPGCVAVAKTEAEVSELIREGVEIYLEETRRDGESIPVPTSRVEYVTVAETASAA